MRAKLLLQPELFYKRTVDPLVARFKILKMLTASGDERKEAAPRVQIFAIFIQMCRKFDDAASQDRHLHLWRTSVGVVPPCLADFVTFFALRKHPKDDITLSS